MRQASCVFFAAVELELVRVTMRKPAALMNIPLKLKEDQRCASPLDKLGHFGISIARGVKISCPSSSLRNTLNGTCESPA